MVRKREGIDGRTERINERTENRREKSGKTCFKQRSMSEGSKGCMFHVNRKQQQHSCSKTKIFKKNQIMKIQTNLLKDRVEHIGLASHADHDEGGARKEKLDKKTENSVAESSTPTSIAAFSLSLPLTVLIYSPQKSASKKV
jgi:hypothetical protein